MNNPLKNPIDVPLPVLNPIQDDENDHLVMEDDQGAIGGIGVSDQLITEENVNENIDGQVNINIDDLRNVSYSTANEGLNDNVRQDDKSALTPPQISQQEYLDFIRFKELGGLSEFVNAQTKLKYTTIELMNKAAHNETLRNEMNSREGNLERIIQERLDIELQRKSREIQQQNQSVENERASSTNSQILTCKSVGFPRDLPSGAHSTQVGDDDRDFASVSSQQSIPPIRPQPNPPVSRAQTSLNIRSTNTNLQIQQRSNVSTSTPSQSQPSRSIINSCQSTGILTAQPVPPQSTLNPSAPTFVNSINPN